MAENIAKLLEAAELLLEDVRNQRIAIDRRERELVDLVATYRAKSHKPSTDSRDASSNGAAHKIFTNEEVDDDLADDDESYGQITDTVIQIMHESKRKINAPQIAAALESRRVPIKAKSYLAAARTVIRRLGEAKKIRRVATGYYRLEKTVEAQLA